MDPLTVAIVIDTIPIERAAHDSQTVGRWLRRLEGPDGFETARSRRFWQLRSSRAAGVPLDISSEVVENGLPALALQLDGILRFGIE
jgi:hypothetical protein